MQSFKWINTFFSVRYCRGNGTNAQLYEVTQLVASRKLLIFFVLFFWWIKNILNFASLEILWNKEIGWITEGFVLLCRHLSHFPLTSFKGDTREKEFTSVFLCLCVGLSISPSFHAKSSLKSATRVHSLLIPAIVTIVMKTLKIAKK